MTINWKNISYLNQGTERQKHAFKCLTNLNLFTDLSSYSPLLAGTIPIDIDNEESDLDIICEVHALPRFAQELEMLYRTCNQFELRRTSLQNKSEVIVCNFNYDGFPIEIFGQNYPVVKQNGYLHMMIEYRLLALAGAGARNKIRELKKLGIKTEPAFGRYFNIKGDPYTKLLVLGELSDQELKEMFHL